MVKEIDPKVLKQLDFSSPQSTERSLILLGIAPIYKKQSFLIHVLITSDCNLDEAVQLVNMESKYEIDENSIHYSTAIGYLWMLRAQAKRVYNFRDNSQSYSRLGLKQFINFLKTGVMTS